MTAGEEADEEMLDGVSEYHIPDVEEIACGSDCESGDESESDFGAEI